VTDLELALALADLADAVSMDRYRKSDLQVTTKPDMTPVSDADRSVERTLRERLTERRPEDSLLGEEYGGSMGTGRAWVIDPIDGTKNYVRGVPVWATLIALTVDGVAQVGVVSAPALARRWWAATGEGSWRSENGSDPVRNQVSGVRHLTDASLSVSDLEGWERGSYLDLIDSVWRVRGYGDFWSHMMVAEGCVDVAAEPELNLWDMAALVPIVLEAGGAITDWSGGSVLESVSAATTNGLLHEAVLSRLVLG
jgi:histidinol-phosphatase